MSSKFEQDILNTNFFLGDIFSFLVHPRDLFQQFSECTADMLNHFHGLYNNNNNDEYDYD